MSTPTQAQLLLRVANKTAQAEGVVSFRLVDALGRALPGFAAGAHIDVQLGPDLVRQYSLCNPSRSPTEYEIAVLREPASRGGSKYMHETLAVGMEFPASAPKNHFQLDAHSPAFLFAGGIGITPLLAMAQQLAEEGRQFELHYCARSRQRAAFRERLAEAAYAGSVHFHYDEEAPSQRLDIASVLSRGSSAHHLYTCGPAGFIQHVLDAGRGAGWPESRMHREFFAAPAADARATADGAFEVELASSGKRFVVPAGTTVLAVLTDAGIEVPASCEAGVCGTCVTRVVEGTPDHRDVYLTDAEHAKNDCFTPCCSRALSQRLVIDL
ncbi:2Fe-2S iron-sulfur cluster binding domain-containing protein [Variovorax paradoxus]|uniref:2Fe-2S iron-sulfur cluster binding domain-containing protein n=1 Tax=Variovorax paradoxus TaxID=34073 RepID=A0A5Q0M643_VARPD|nr:PDR/VanB family oxidoreductase [Variovorax paradoxus]QFZ85121.1 2Fe-2S iron-sulfur cluster binding domain-containing protein [Variovorax paradoxus]